MALLNEGSEDAFETERLLTAVDELDQLRYILADREEEPDCVPRPPEMRDKLMELHTLVFNHGYQVSRESLCKAAVILEDIDMQVFGIVEHAEKIMKILRDLRSALPEFSEEEYDKAYE